MKKKPSKKIIKTSKTKTTKASNKKVIQKLSSTKKPKKQLAPKKRIEKRLHKRFSTPGLYASEKFDGIILVSEVLNISESGLFLKNRVISGSRLSQITLPSKKGALTLDAVMVRDQTQDSKKTGTGYQFINLSKTQKDGLGKLLRNLN